MWRSKMPAVSAKKLRARLSLNLPIDSNDLLSCDNVKLVNGSLQNACGFQPQDYFSAFYAIKVLAELRVWTYVLAKQGLYGVKEEMPTTAMKDSFTNACGCTYQNNFVFSAPNKGTYFSTATKLTQNTTWGCNSLTVCSDRLFAIDTENHLCIAPVGQLDFADAVKISPHTKIDAVVTVGKKLYALGNTCYAVEPYHADDVDVTFRAISHGAGVAQADSVATFGNRAVFATDCGLKMLQSDKVTPIFSDLNTLVDFNGSVACNHGGRYYVSCKRLDGSQERNDVTLILDVDGEKVVGVLNQGFESICSLGQKLYATSDGALLLMDDTPSDAFWQRTVDFDSSGVKYLEALHIKSKQDVKLIIQTDNETRWYRVKGKSVVQRVPLAGCGRTFTVTVEAQGGMKVDYLELTARTYEV